MSISGNLKTMELSELLQWLSQGQKTGTLVIDRGDVEKRICFEEGYITSTSSTDPKEHLGHFLVSYGFIDEVTLAKAMEMQSEANMLLGKILITIEAIAEEQLDRMLTLKAEESLYDVFTWPEGEFQFISGTVPDRPMVPMRVDVPGVVLEGMHRVDQWRRIREKIPTRQAVPVIVGSLAGVTDEPRAARILAMVNNDRTLEEITLQTHSSEYHVSRIIFEQVEAGNIKIVRARALPSFEPAADLDSPDAESLLSTARQSLDAGDLVNALRYGRAARSLEPERHLIRKGVEMLEEDVAAEVEKAGIGMKCIPKLTIPLDNISSLDLTPEEGFIVSRVDGVYDIETIVKISPMAPLEAQVIFWKLEAAGYITTT